MNLSVTHGNSPALEVTADAPLTCAVVPRNPLNDQKTLVNGQPVASCRCMGFGPQPLQRAETVCVMDYRTTQRSAGGSPARSPMKMNNQEQPRRGWRSFLCEDCGHDWAAPTRDCFSPSGENCPMCTAWCTPRNRQPDPSLPCDDMGNLT